MLIMPIVDANTTEDFTFRSAIVLFYLRYSIIKLDMVIV